MAVLDATKENNSYIKPRIGHSHVYTHTHTHPTYNAFLRSFGLIITMMIIKVNKLLKFFLNTDI